MNEQSKGTLAPNERKAVERIAKAAGQFMFDNYESLPIHYRITLENIIKTAYRVLDDQYWMTS
jgi:hypothetical protein